MKGEILFEVTQEGKSGNLDFFLVGKKGEVLSNFRAMISSHLTSMPESFLSETDMSKIEKEKLSAIVNQVCDKLLERFPESHAGYIEALEFSKRVHEELERYLGNGKED